MVKMKLDFAPEITSFINLFVIPVSEQESALIINSNPEEINCQDDIYFYNDYRHQTLIKIQTPTGTNWAFGDVDAGVFLVFEESKELAEIILYLESEYEFCTSSEE